MTQPSGEGPQDAPLGQPWPVPQPSSGPAAQPTAGGPPVDPDTSSVGAFPPPPAAEHQAPTPVPGSSSSTRPSAPTGPNWGLVSVGVLLVLAAGLLLAYLLGYRPDADVRFGPQALIALGAALLLVGAVGSLARRRLSASRRRRRATRCR